MLPKDTKVKPSIHSNLYDILIPEDNKLRRLKNLIDFSFIHDELKSKYSINTGRTAIPPVQLFKYLYLKVLFNLSDRDLVERAKTDLSFKFFLGLNPEDMVIHPSLLSKFRRQRLKDSDILDLLIKKSVEIAIENGVIERGTIIVDATHTSSVFNQNSPLTALRSYSKIFRSKLYKVNNSIKSELPEPCHSRKLSDEQEYNEKLLSIVKSKPELLSSPIVSESFNKLEELQGDIKYYMKFSKDHDARLGHKSVDRSFFGFKTHLAMSENRIITAANITSGENGDGKYLEGLIKESNENGMNVREVIGDHAYSGKTNLQFTKENNIDLLAKLTPIITKGKRKDNKIWDYNKDAGMFICPAGHMAIRKTVKNRQNSLGNNNNSMCYYFDVNKCKNCPLRDGCYKTGARTKSYAVVIKSNEHFDQESFEKTKYFNEKIKDRYKIEAKNAEMKNKHGYDKSWSDGITSMTLQGAMTIFCTNMKRISKLIYEK